jgi:hypothetical protein
VGAEKIRRIEACPAIRMGFFLCLKHWENSDFGLFSDYTRIRRIEGNGHS